MTSTTILLIIAAFVVSLLVGYLFYFFKEKTRAKFIWFLFSLRTLAVFLLLVAFINPSMVFTSFIIEKPQLNILVDNSKSIQFLGEKTNLKNTLNALINDEDIKNKFAINSFTFGSDFDLLDTVSSSDPQTNITQALIQINKLNTGGNQLAILLSDGNQTNGLDYKNYVSKTPIYPIVFGDTLSFEDVLISQINVNKYTYVGNEFPVEVFVSLQSNDKKQVVLLVKRNGRVLVKKSIEILPNSSKRISFNLASLQKGNAFYSVEVSKLTNEKNTQNNIKKFSIESIDQKSKTLLVSAIRHPDIGSLKRSIERNQKRTLEIKKPAEVTNVETYQSIILYQPNPSFASLMNLLKEKDKNVFLITGSQTNYQFLNNQSLGFSKKSIDDVERATAIFNPNFIPFQQDDLGFEGFSPLLDVFGDISFTKPYSVLLKQRLNGIETNQPLLVSMNNENRKTVVLFGEGVWQWRAASFLRENSFQRFDTFISNLVQYITNSTTKSRLEVTVDPIHYTNQPVVFTSYFFDENYQFDKNATLELQLSKETLNEKLTYPFANRKTNYQVQIENVSSGVYEYLVTEKRSGINRKGKIEVLQREIEAQFTNANKKGLQVLANNSNGQLFYKNETKKVLQFLKDNPNYQKIQKPTKKERSILDWWHYLLLVCLLFSCEWFIRKYHGKI